MNLTVSPHAVKRYQERVAPVSWDEAEAALSSKNIAKAAAFGATYVRLGCGASVVLDGFRVCTVLPAQGLIPRAHYIARQADRRRHGQ